MENMIANMITQDKLMGLLGNTCKYAEMCHNIQRQPHLQNMS